jgi:hypothetical protein
MDAARSAAVRVEPANAASSIKRLEGNQRQRCSVPTRVVGNYELLSCASGRSQAGPAQKRGTVCHGKREDNFSRHHDTFPDKPTASASQTAKRTRAQGRVRVVAFLAALRRVRAARRAARRSVGRGGWRCARVRGRGLGDRLVVRIEIEMQALHFSLELWNGRMSTARARATSCCCWRQAHATLELQARVTCTATLCLLPV